MKAIIILLVLFSTSNLNAFEANLFKTNYPNFQTYQLSLFSQLRNYFETLPLNTLNFTELNGTRIYKLRGKHDDSITTIFSKIIRERGTIGNNRKIVERVIYALENGKTLEYSITKEGNDITDTDDLDLLSFHFKSSKQDEFYQISMPAFNIQITHSQQADGEKTFFFMGFMDFNFQIESHFKEHEASLNYIYFFTQMPGNPQSTLTVQAIEAPGSWNSINYYHISSNTGEITPKQFFQGLAGGSMAISEGSSEIFKSTLLMGFPKLD